MIALDIGSAENIARQSALTAAQALDGYEARIARRFGFARRSWELSKVLACACTLALVAIATGAAQVGGAL